MFNEDKERRVLPRWRDSLATVAAGELNPLSTRNIPSSRPEFLASKIEDWRKHRTISFAADLVGAAVVLDMESEVKEAAEFLVANASQASDAALKLAKRILHIPTQEFNPALETYQEPSNLEIPKKKIQRLRRRLRDDPRNALAWIDIARFYSILGQNKQAQHAVQNGITLASENRFVLRSGARFYVHIDDPEVGHQLLYRCDRTQSDPWLLAAEIATATVVGRTSRFVRRARTLLTHNPPSQTTELASAIATLELKAGNNRIARKLFEQSLIEPTDNSIAQVEWASEKISNLTLERRHLNAPLSYEARALDFYADGRWSESSNECLKWLDDEPYSSRPAVLGTFISSVALENYRDAVRLAYRSLKANPGNQLLLNNLTFALASIGKLDEAKKEYGEIKPDLCDEGEKIARLATGGLLLFREGHIEEGRLLYRKALDLAKNDLFRTALAASFLAREEIFAGTTQAQIAYENAVQAAKAVKLKSLAGVLNLVLERMRNRMNESEKNKPRNEST